MILNSPTIFGRSGNSLLGGGEAGPEAVVGVSSLMDMIQSAVANTQMTADSGDITIPYIPQEDALRNSIEHFAGCIREGKESLANGEQGIKVIRILDRAKEKLKANSL